MKDNSPSYIYRKDIVPELLSISLLEKIEQLNNPQNSFGQNILLKSSYNCSMIPPICAAKIRKFFKSRKKSPIFYKNRGKNSSIFVFFGEMIPRILVFCKLSGLNA